MNSKSRTRRLSSANVTAMAPTRSMALDVAIDASEDTHDVASVAIPRRAPMQAARSEAEAATTQLARVLLAECWQWPKRPQ